MLEGKRKKILVTELLILHPIKTVVQIAAIQMTIDHLLEIGTEESVGPSEPFRIEMEEVFQMILDTVIIITGDL